MLNDVSALTHDPESLGLAAASGRPVCLMHARGDPRTMQDAPVYADALAEVWAYLAERVAAAEVAGIPRVRILVDPGIGFGKTADHNVIVLRHLGELTTLGRPILLGTSRKSTIGRILDLPVQERLEGTLATTALGVAAGVDIVRVHDVEANVRAARVSDAIVRGRWRSEPEGGPA
jgi:dihydropteroate synthase